MQVYAVPASRYSSEFKCFWGSFHVKPAALIIGIVEIIAAICYLINILQMDLDSTSQFYKITYFLIAISVCICLVSGLMKENSKFLLPYLIYKIWWILVYVVVIFMCVMAFVDPSSEFGKNIYGQLTERFKFKTEQYKNDVFAIQLSALFVIWMHTIQITIFIWWFSIVLRCYKYFNKIVKFYENDYVATNYASSFIV